MKGKINGIGSNVLLDSGALGVSVIDTGTLERLNLRSLVKAEKYNCTDASGNSMKIIGSVSLEVQIIGTNRTVTHTFRVLDADSGHDVICGTDFMRHFKQVEFDFENNRVRLGNNWLKPAKGKKETVRLCENETLEPRSEKVISVKCSKNHGLLSSEFRPKSIPGVSGVYLSRAIVSPDVNGHFLITMVNVNVKSVSLKKKQVVGMIDTSQERVTQIKVVEEVREDKQVGGTTEPYEKCVVGDNLSADEKEIMKSLLKKHASLFASDPKKPNCTNRVEHRILTGDALPVYMKPRRVPVAWESDINQQVEQMLENGIIRPSCSPWNSPIILVDKKDASKRFVCDYRGLNQVTKKDTYPLPHIHDVVDKMHGAVYWSSLDAASAYWAMPIREVDKEKTAFSVPRGKFEFNVMSYGLCNAGASYQRLMDLTLSGLPPDRTLAYMDDIVVYTKTFDEHVTALDAVLTRLGESGIQLRADKCVLGVHDLEFLGFELSKKGIKPQKRLTQAVRDFPAPKSRKEVRRFLGLSGFYRSFIKHYATIAKPLSELTSEKVNFKWTEEREKSFNDLKNALLSAPVLAFPQPSKEFVLEVDASGVAVGGVLSQYQNDGLLHPVAFFSTALKPEQRDWSPYNQEAFAMVCAVEHWHVYLTGNTFVLNSDHSPLVSLRKKEKLRGKVARWIALLESFDFEVKHLPGKENQKADALSRNPGAAKDQPEDILDDMVDTILVENDTFVQQLRNEQEKFLPIASTKRSVEEGVPVEEGQLKRIRKQLRIENGILTKSGRPIVPPSMRRYVYDKYHQMNHFATEKMYQLLQKRFYWPNMYSFIQNEVSSCVTCSQCKADSPTAKAPLVPLREPQSPMEFIALDIAYMPTDVNGHSYILLIGDVFSKYIEAVPLKDQTAVSIKLALWEQWLTRYSYPQFLLTDQGSNVDGEVMNELCTNFNIEKRRTSGYHSQGNGFAERNIRTVKELFQTLLLEHKLPQNLWTELLPSIIFALNTSESSATKCAPYQVIFGREPTFPTDILMDTLVPQISARSPAEYVKDLRLQMRDIIQRVNENLGISKTAMLKQYNKNLRFYDYKAGEKVWLKRRHFKPGENRKLSPRKTGPWTVICKKPNGVNFEIENSKKKRQVVHHDRLAPFRHRSPGLDEADEVVQPTPSQDEVSPSSFGEEYSSTDSDSDTGAPPAQENERRYPLRNRRQPQREGYVPWDVIDHRIPDR